MRLELVEGQLRVDGDAVAHDVQVAGLEVDEAIAAAGWRDVRIADLPLIGDRPVEHPRPGCHAAASDRDLGRNAIERRTRTRADDAPTDRIEVLDEPLIRFDVRPSMASSQAD